MGSTTDSGCGPPPGGGDPRRGGRASRRAGYVVAVIVNAVLIYVVHHLLDWGWFDFLTDDFDRLVPIITVSLLASVAANAVFVVSDPPWVRALGGLVTSSIGVAVAVRWLQVMPVDFSGWDSDWTWLVRLVTVVGLVGSAIGALVNLVKLLTYAAAAGSRRRSA